MAMSKSGSLFLNHIFEAIQMQNTRYYFKVFAEIIHLLKLYFGFLHDRFEYIFFFYAWVKI